MVKDFEQLVLRYLVQPEYQAQKYIPLIGAKVFEFWDYQVTFTLLSNYEEKYNVQPSKGEFLQYCKVHLIQLDYQDEEIETVSKFIQKDLFKPLEGTEGVFVKDTLVEFAQERLTSSLFTEYADKIKGGGSGVFKTVFERMSEIIALGEEEWDAMQEEGSLLHRDGKVHKKFGVVRMREYDEDDIKLIQMPFRGLNNTMAARGLYTPQFAILLAGSKAFKTGILIAIAVGLVRQGYNVYYADGENGLMSIQNRVIQAHVECTLRELIFDEFYEPEPLQEGFLPGNHVTDMSPNEVFDKISEAMVKYGGEFAFDSYAPGACTMMDVDKNLQKWEAKGFKPDIILYDAIEHFIPIVKQQTDVLSSQQVLKEAFGLNRRWKMAGMSPAQVTRDAIKKDIYGIDDIGRDYGIIRYAHAIWAINRTKDEKEAGIAQLYSVVQREGMSSVVACMLKIEEAKMKVNEISYEQAAKLLEEVTGTTKKKERKRKKVKESETTDD